MINRIPIAVIKSSIKGGECSVIGGMSGKFINKWLNETYLFTVDLFEFFFDVILMMAPKDDFYKEILPYKTKSRENH